MSNLAELCPGQTGIVTGYKEAASMRRRLQDLGFVPGTCVKCLGKSPLGDPCAYLVRKTVVALRREDAGQVTVEPCGSGQAAVRRKETGQAAPEAEKAVQAAEASRKRKGTGRWKK